MPQRHSAPDLAMAHGGSTNGFPKGGHRNGMPATTGALESSPPSRLLGNGIDRPMSGGTFDSNPGFGSPSRTMLTSAPCSEAIVMGGDGMLLPPPMESDTNADRFRRLCLVNDA